MIEQKNIEKYLLRLADSNLILGQRMAEWISNAPTLEEDIALANYSLDLIGQSKLIYNELSNKTDLSENDLAFSRNEREYYNMLITEMPNKNFGNTIIRNYLYSSFMLLLLAKLENSKNQFIKEYSIKTIKEVKFHYKYYHNWIIRLGNGTKKSNKILQKSIDYLWKYTDDMFCHFENDSKLINNNILPNNSTIKEEWLNKLKELLLNSNLDFPTNNYMITGSIDSIHTEHLGHILTEMQYLHNAYPNENW